MPFGNLFEFFEHMLGIKDQPHIHLIYYEDLILVSMVCYRGLLYLLLADWSQLCAGATSKQCYLCAGRLDNSNVLLFLELSWVGMISLMCKKVSHCICSNLIKANLFLELLVGIANSMEQHEITPRCYLFG